jgi:Fic family protein
VAQDLLELPVLYLSSYIIQHKEEYYSQLQLAREVNDWRPWLIYMLDGVEKTAKNTIALIGQIKTLMRSYKVKMRTELPKIYRQELLNNLFHHPYTKIDFVMKDLSVSRITATKYLELLVEHEFLVKEKVGRVNFYINKPLFELFIAP